RNSRRKAEASPSAGSAAPDSSTCSIGGQPPVSVIGADAATVLPLQALGWAQVTERLTAREGVRLTYFVRASAGFRWARLTSFRTARAGVHSRRSSKYEYTTGVTSSVSSRHSTCPPRIV